MFSGQNSCKRWSRFKHVKSSSLSAELHRWINFVMRSWGEQLRNVRRSSRCERDRCVLLLLLLQWKPNLLHRPGSVFVCGSDACLRRPNDSAHSHKYLRSVQSGWISCSNNRQWCIFVSGRRSRATPQAFSARLTSLTHNCCCSKRLPFTFSLVSLVLNGLRGWTGSSDRPAYS